MLFPMGRLYYLWDSTVGVEGIAYEENLATNSETWDGYTVVGRIPAAQIAALSDGPNTTITLTIQGGTLKNFDVAAFYIGLGATGGGAALPQFATTPVQVESGGLTSFSAPKLSTLQLDPATLVWDGTSDLVWSATCSDSNDELATTVATGIGSIFYKTGADAATVAKTGYTASSHNPGIMGLVCEVQMDGYVTGGGDGDGGDGGGAGGSGTPIGFTGGYLLFGTLRNTGSGWEVLNDSGHAPLNVTSVTSVNGSSTSGYILVEFSAMSKVGTLVCGPDDTFAGEGFSFGASVEIGSAKIFCGQNGAKVSPNSCISSAGNIWFMGAMWS